MPHRSPAHWLAAAVLFCALSAQAQEEAALLPPTAAPPPTDAPVSLLTSLRESMWGELYYQGAYSSRDRHNYINDLTLRQGLRTFELRGNPVEIYLKARILQDLNADFWNNVAEVGVGARYRPFNRFGLILFSEALGGMYTGRETEDKIPEEFYANFIAGFAFWQWWGVQPYAIEDGAHFYWPLTGWRETYADGIYNHRDSNNFIATGTYKEGILLGKAGPMTYAAYLGLGAGTDANGDSWNNYLYAGPGISIAPFDNHDLKISCEYRSGFEYRGDADADLGSYDDVNVTISYSLSW